MIESLMELHHEGAPLRMATAGKGECVILLHGYPENLQVFSAIFPALAHEHRVIAFDWPGMGYSRDWKGGMTPVLMAGRLKELMDDWGVEKAHLIAQDMGAQPALVFAASYPERVRSIIVMNALIADDADTSWEIRLLRKFRINQLLLRHFPALVFFRALQTFLPFSYRPDAALRKDMWRAFRQPAVRECIIRMCAGYGAQLKRLPQHYSRVRCPTLILWGAEDKHFPPVQAGALKDLIPHAECRIMEGATHWMVLQQPHAVLQHILEFYRGINS